MSSSPESSASEGGFGSDMSIGTLKQVLRKTQAKSNARSVQLAEKDRRIATLTNRAETVPKDHQEPPKKNVYIQDSKKRSQVGKLAREFTYMYAFWVSPTDEEILTLELDPSYNPRERFSSTGEKQQGLVFDLINLIPNDIHTRFQESDYVEQFFADMDQQRSNASSRLTQTGPYILGCTKEVFDDNQCRFNTFKSLIGFCGQTDGKDTYTVLAPILYKEDPNEKRKKWRIFRHPILMRTYSALVRGPSSVKCLSDGQVTRKLSHANLESQWKLSCITPGAIAMAATLARFIASADRSLLPCGAQTQINYQSDYDTYFEYLHTGLHEKRVSVIDIFKTWNEIFYPDSANLPAKSSSSVPEDVTFLFDDLKDDEIAEESSQSEPEQDPPLTQAEARNSTPASHDEEDDTLAPRMSPAFNQPSSPLTDIEATTPRVHLEGQPSSPLGDISNSLHGHHASQNSIIRMQSSTNQSLRKRRVIQSDEEEESTGPTFARRNRGDRKKRRKAAPLESANENVSPQVRRSSRSKKH